jgi:hypothetical protein
MDGLQVTAAVTLVVSACGATGHICNSDPWLQHFDIRLLFECGNPWWQYL